MRDSSYISNFNIIHMLKAAVFTACLIFACIYISKVYTEASEKNVINAWNKQRFEEFYNMPKNSLDMVFIGSSHSYCTFDPLLIDGAIGINSFQMGMPLQMPDGSYYTLKEILNYQSPSVVVMEIYWKLLESEFDLKQAETLFQVLNNEEIKKEFISDGFKLAERIKYYLPVVRFQQDYIAYHNKELLDWFEAEYGLKKETQVQAGTEYYSKKGFMHCDYNIPLDKYGSGNQFNGFDGKKWVFNERQKKYLQKIIQLCKQENIELVFVTAPVANVSMGKIKNYDIVHRMIAEFASENDVPYLDFNYNIQNGINESLFTNDNFRDDAHLNYSGAVIACEYFAEYILSDRQ